jgi:hypothetical protein
LLKEFELDWLEIQREMNENATPSIIMQIFKSREKSPSENRKNIRHGTEFCSTRQVVSDLIIQLSRNINY